MDPREEPEPSFSITAMLLTILLLPIIVFGIKQISDNFYKSKTFKKVPEKITKEFNNCVEGEEYKFTDKDEYPCYFFPREYPEDIESPICVIGTYYIFKNKRFPCYLYKFQKEKRKLRVDCNKENWYQDEKCLELYTPTQGDPMYIPKMNIRKNGKCIFMFDPVEGIICK